MADGFEPFAGCRETLIRVGGSHGYEFFTIFHWKLKCPVERGTRFEEYGVTRTGVIERRLKVTSLINDYRFWTMGGPIPTRAGAQDRNYHHYRHR